MYYLLNVGVLLFDPVEVHVQMFYCITNTIPVVSVVFTTD